MSKKLAYEFLASSVWALEGNFLERMAKVVTREELGTFEALEAKAGVKVSQLTEIRNGVAVIHVNGVISRYANLMHAICGGVSTELLSKDFNKALNDSSIKGIVLNIDSPGGEANGIHELGEMIYQARGIKPIKAYIGGMGCSAAYWIASACDQITLDATASVGSIGVVASVIKQEEKEGQTRYEFVSSQSPNKRLDIASEAGQQAMQTQLDQMADVFIDRVARNRGTNRNQVIQKFGQGSVVIGIEAVNRGMVNQLGSLENVINSLGKKSTMQNTKSEIKTSTTRNASDLFAMAANGNYSVEAMASAIQEQFPDVADFIKGASATQEIQKIGAQLALDMASDANLPLITRKLSEMPLDAAKSYLENANQLKNVLSIAGLNSSFDHLVNFIDEPAKLTGLAIHEIKAMIDEEAELTRCINGGERASMHTGVDPDSIYKTRTNANR